MRCCPRHKAQLNTRQVWNHMFAGRQMPAPLPKARAARIPLSAAACSRMSHWKTAQSHGKRPDTSDSGMRTRTHPPTHSTAVVSAPVQGAGGGKIQKVGACGWSSVWHRAIIHLGTALVTSLGHEGPKTPAIPKRKRPSAVSISTSPNLQNMSKIDLGQGLIARIFGFWNRSAPFRSSGSLGQLTLV